MFLRTAFAAMLLLSLPALTPALAQAPEAPAAVDAPPPPESALQEPAAAPASAAAAPVPLDNPVYTQDTPVEKIAADPQAKAILDRDIPGLLSDIRYPLFKGMSLKAMSQASDGDLTQETVNKTVADLQALFPR